jgi:hypothetical protein
MHLDQLQQQLEQLNQIRAPLKVCEVLLAPCAAQRLRGQHIRSAREQVFTWQDHAELHIGVYIDPRLQCRLALHDPRQQLDDHNLPALLSAAEGISHFLALSWCAERDRPVSALELELQAEVDKFLLCLQLRQGQTGSLDAAALFARMFERVQFDPQLSAAEQQRYRMAHRCAARLILDWLNRYGERIDDPRWQAEARSFFRLSASDKLRLVELLRR